MCMIIYLSHMCMQFMKYLSLMKHFATSLCNISIMLSYDVCTIIICMRPTAQSAARTTNMFKKSLYIYIYIYPYI